MEELYSTQQPLVSVHMITYNHEKYIAQAIEGVLMQKTNFLFELVIGEDCSTDSTRVICKEYADRYPNIIKLLPDAGKNLGMMENAIRTTMACTGKYIALCEGDDYWTDPYKLQKQVDFLEANPDFVFTFHDAFIPNEKTGEKHLRIGDRIIDEIVDLKSVIIQNNIPTASIVFRNILNSKSLPDWFCKIAKGDYGLCVLLAEKGPGKFFREPMSVYRVHEGGVWSGSDFEKIHKANLAFYNYLLKYFTDRDIQNAIRAKIRWTNYNYGISQIRNANFFKGGINIISNLQLRGDKRVRTNLRKIPGAVKTCIKKLLKQVKIA